MQKPKPNFHHIILQAVARVPNAQTPKPAPACPSPWQGGCAGGRRRLAGNPCINVSKLRRGQHLLLLGSLAADLLRQIYPSIILTIIVVAVRLTGTAASGIRVGGAVVGCWLRGVPVHHGAGGGLGVRVCGA
jgi:hypothetical protein